MTSEPLRTVELASSRDPDAAVIWLHGLGANGHDFEPVVPQLGLDPKLAVRFVFPHAPERAVTINQGVVMPAWYDIYGFEIDREEDREGIRDSGQKIRQLIEREHERGVAFDHIALAGFSQGGAIALQTGLRYPERLGGILALSCYAPLADTLIAERSEANGNVPIFQAFPIFKAESRDSEGSRDGNKVEIQCRESMAPRGPPRSSWGVALPIA